jgi:hypothetical protein
MNVEPEVREADQNAIGDRRQRLCLGVEQKQVTTPDYPRSEAICYRSLSQRLRRKFAQQFAQQFA